MVNDSSQPAEEEADVLIVPHDELQSELDNDAVKPPKISFGGTDIRSRPRINSAPEEGYRESSREGRSGKDMRDVMRNRPGRSGKRGGHQGRGGSVDKRPARNANYQAKEPRATTSRGPGSGGKAPDSGGKRTASKSNSDRGSKRPRRRKSTKETSSKAQPTPANSGKDKGTKRES